MSDKVKSLKKDEPLNVSTENILSDNNELVSDGKISKTVETVSCSTGTSPPPMDLNENPKNVESLPKIIKSSALKTSTTSTGTSPPPQTISTQVSGCFS